MPVRVNTRIWLAFVHDVIATALAWTGAFFFRFNFDIGSIPFASFAASRGSACRRRQCCGSCR